LKKKLERLDNYSKQGHWTNKVLLTIKDNPNLHAIGIAKLTGFEKNWLKLNIRKLKNLGLTMSHHIGYEVSPLGNKYLDKLSNCKS
jgi:predicted transcriptional regulator